MKTNKNNKDVRQKTLDNKQQIKFYKIKIINLFWALCISSCLLGLSLVSGCNSTNQIDKLKTQIKDLEKEKAQLANEIEQTDSENEDLKEQIRVLQALPDHVKAENLYQLENIKIHNYSAFSDENDDGKIDTLIVRIQPYDNYGDLIKAPGKVEVELWDLDKPDGQAKLGQWEISEEELKEKWNATWVTNYRLVFDVSDKPESFDHPLTIKVKFTDYLSGKVFQEQKVIEP